MIKRILFLILVVALSSGCSGGMAPSNIATEVVDDATAGTISPTLLTASGAVSGADAATYLDQLFNGSGDGRRSLEIPNFSYFQGVLHSNRHILVVGQVRMVGGLVVSYDGGTVDLHRGAMVTSSPDYYMSRFGQLQGGSNQGQFYVADWKEVPAN